MKNLTPCFYLFFIIWACSPLELENISLSGEVRCKVISVNPFMGNIPNGRTGTASEWEHVFKDQASLEVTHQITGEVYELLYNPNEFGDGFSLSLPYGSYSYFSEVEGKAYEQYLPFRIEGEFVLNAQSMDINMKAITSYGLITVKDEHLSSLGIRSGPDFYEMARLQDGSHYFIYAREDQEATLEIKDAFGGPLITREVAVKAYKHYHFFLKLATEIGSANFIELALVEFRLIEEGIEIGEGEADTFTDPRDGQIYNLVQVGEQIWMAENLNYATDESWCYDEDPANCARYGRLYTRQAALTACPDGWHLPNLEEWEVLADHLGGQEVAGGKMKSTTGWDLPNTGANNESGFSALPGGFGFVSPPNKGFNGRRSSGDWWSSGETIWHDTFGWVNHYTSVSYARENLDIDPIDEESLYIYACRCLKD